MSHLIKIYSALQCQLFSSLVLDKSANSICIVWPSIWVCFAKDNYFKNAFQSDQITYLTLQAWAEMELRLTSPPNEEREQKFQEGTHAHIFLIS